MCKGILSAHSLSKIKTQINKNCCLPMKRQRQRETKRERNKERNAENNSRKKAATASVAYITAVFSVIGQYQLTPPSFPSPACSYPLLVYSTFRRGLWRHQSGWVYRPSGCGYTEKTPSRLRDLAYTEDDGDEHVAHRCGAAAGAGSF